MFISQLLFRPLPHQRFKLGVLQSKNAYFRPNQCHIFETKNCYHKKPDLSQILSHYDGVPIENLMTLSSIKVTNARGHTGTLILVKPIDKDIVHEIKNFMKLAKDKDIRDFLNQDEIKLQNYRLQITLLDMPRDVDLIEVLEELIKNPPFEFKISSVEVDITKYITKDNDHNNELNENLNDPNDKKIDQNTSDESKNDEKYILNFMKNPQDDFTVIMNNFLREVLKRMANPTQFQKSFAHSRKIIEIPLNEKDMKAKRKFLEQQLPRFKSRKLSHESRVSSSSEISPLQRISSSHSFSDPSSLIDLPPIFDKK